MTFDYAAQKAETERLWAEMSAAHDLPAEGRLDLHFFPDGADADATEFMGWLEDNGFEVEHYPADDDPEEGDDGRETIEAQTGVMPLSPATIHAEERRTTEAALRFGFRPDGWGFMGA
ncbi:ribonuclease E inhibitor RraB [Jannaschia rubra]|uniref:Regulator of ribonuclease activity B domain-containing protein n=1 Tax=Jannaschia rubra TaxID=282197 RepID=A0A0M6XRU7_9RHOB|nr:ribonuclease E inhibitor RraB [Jannaschia rubra]CTQ33866.1 hypothetical protein JAN5088_02652 [Jannaschia rubra]SFG11203.1 Regulator of ribonuclease activity B [Jannaschia rubra]